MKYIDISTFQKTTDFAGVKSNVDGVIIRAGYGAGNIDAQFQRNASECNRLNIPCGAGDLPALAHGSQDPAGRE